MGVGVPGIAVRYMWLDDVRPKKGIKITTDTHQLQASLHNVTCSFYLIHVARQRVQCVHCPHVL